MQSLLFLTFNHALLNDSDGVGDSYIFLDFVLSVPSSAPMFATSSAYLLAGWMFCH